MSVNQVSIGSDNGLLPIRHQAIIWNIAGLLSVGPLGTNFSEILTKIQNFKFTNMHLKISSAKRWPCCPAWDEFMFGGGEWRIMLHQVVMINDVTIHYCITWVWWHQNEYHMTGMHAIVSVPGRVALRAMSWSTFIMLKCTVGKWLLALTHWGRVTHICISKLTIIGSDNGLSPGRRQAIIWAKAGILLIGLLGRNFIEILIGIQKVSFKKMHLKMSSLKWCPFCLGLNVLS